MAAYTIAGPALGGAVAVALILARDAVPGRVAIRLLAPLGRVSLSAYLLQSVAFTGVFYFHGLGLYGKLGFPALLALAVCFWFLELLVARLWLQRFRSGPAEWLLRRMVYGPARPPEAADMRAGAG
jgi:uncharacterized protein